MPGERWPRGRESFRSDFKPREGGPPRGGPPRGDRALRGGEKRRWGKPWLESGPRREGKPGQERGPRREGRPWRERGPRHEGRTWPGKGPRHGKPPWLGKETGRGERTDRGPAPRAGEQRRRGKPWLESGPRREGKPWQDRGQRREGKPWQEKRAQSGSEPRRVEGPRREGRAWPGKGPRQGNPPWPGRKTERGKRPWRAGEPRRQEPFRRERKPGPWSRPPGEADAERGRPAPRIEIGSGRAETGPPRLLVATEDGKIYDHPWLEVLPARVGDEPPAELGGPALFRPLPAGSRAALLPGRRAIGWDPREKRRVEVETLEIDGVPQRVFAAAAILAPAWLRLRCPAFAKSPEAPPLPQWAYTDAGWQGEGIVAATVRIDPRTHWDPRFYNTPDLKGRVERRLAGSPTNRVLRQLARCALEYSCTTAQNVFYQRHEAALPVSAACNAECLGCLSYRPPGGAPSSHERVPATARVEDLVEVALEHLRAAPDGIVSFGQGCEGEPLLAAERLERAVVSIRARTRGGTLHLNTNASLPAMVGRLFNAGLDSIRVSLNSAVPERYARYYQPSGYAFDDVRTSIGVARGKGGFVALNVLVHPGLSDRPSEIEALVRLVKEYRVDLLELRNLAIDPDEYLILYPEPEEPLGMGELLRRLRSATPEARLGNFNLPRTEWGLAAAR